MLLFCTVYESTVRGFLSFYLREKGDNAILFIRLSKFFNLLFREEGRKNREFTFNFLNTFLPFRLVRFLNVLVPLANRIYRYFARDFQVLRPNFLPLAVTRRRINDQGKLNRRNKLLFCGDFFPLLPANDRLLLADRFLANNLTVYGFFVRLRRLLLRANGVTNVDSVNFFFVQWVLRLGN